MRALVPVGVLLGALAGSAWAVDVPMAITFGYRPAPNGVTQATVVVSNASPGELVLLVGVAHERPRAYRAIVRRELWEVADAYGTAVFGINQPEPRELDPATQIPSHSIWVAIDGLNGHGVVRLPDGMPVRDTLAARLTAPGETPSTDTIFTAEGSNLTFVVLHPGTGGDAAIGFYSDGRDGDNDGKINRWIAGGSHVLVPLGDRPVGGPRKVEADDATVWVSEDDFAYHENWSTR